MIIGNPKIKVLGLIALAGSNALINIYTSPQPTAGGAATGTLLGTLTTDTVLGVVTDGGANWVLTFNPIASDSLADASGDAAWARIISATGDWCLDMDIGISGTALIIDSITIYQGGIINITSGIITVAK